MPNNIRAMYMVMRDAGKPRAALDELVHRRLRDVLISAYLHVPYYRELMRKAGYDPVKDYRGPADLQRLPITTKRALKAQGITSLIKEGSDLARCHTDATSGSTGIPFRVYRSPFERSIQIARWLRVLIENGYSPFDRTMSLTAPSRLEEGKSVLQRFGLLRRLAVDYLLHSPSQMVDILLDYRPDVLYGNRSHLDLMAWELEKRGARYEGLKLLFVTGETIFESTREWYRQRFGTELRAVYGSVEMGVMAHETPTSHGLVPCSDLTYFEFLDQQGCPVTPDQVGRVIVTDLTGKLMPFIRYDQGDWATYEYRADMRGHLIPVIRQIQGRDGDLVQLPDGTRRTTHDFSLLIKRYEGIQQFQVVQHARDRFRVLVVADESYLAHIHDDLLQSLHSAFPPEVTFALVPAKNIEPDSSGKTKLFVREIPAPNRSTS